MNEDILKQRYTDLRIEVKKCKNGSQEKRARKEDLRVFLKEVESSFGIQAVSFLTRKKRG